MKFLGMAKANMAMAKTKLMTNVIMATGGTYTRNYISSILEAILWVVLGIGGFILVIAGVKDFVKSFMGETKDWKGVMLGGLTILIGGALMVASVGAVLNIAHSVGSDFGVVH